MASITRSVWRACRRSLTTATTTSSPLRVAVLYQELDPPPVNGIRKPKKPNGYRDSSADIAYTLQSSPSHPPIDLITPTPGPDSLDPTLESAWSFPDTEAGILDALSRGATHIWANTVLFASHPLQTSSRIAAEFGLDRIRVVGQGPLTLGKYDDKAWTAEWLRRTKGFKFTLPRSWVVREEEGVGELERLVAQGEVTFPVVAKPIRGRGSHGVKVCRGKEEWMAHVEGLWKESPAVLVEKFLAGEEATVTVLPPVVGNDDINSYDNNEVGEDGTDKGYRALPIVRRFNHADGVAPYSGIVAVTANSRVVPREEVERDPTYVRAMDECKRAAELLRVAGPIRIDVRRRRDEPGSEFALFDVNMKPNVTGPGRPGRDDQANLSLLAAEGLGWNYDRYLRRVLSSAKTLRAFRSLEPVAEPVVDE
ncbi:uncharacterized protein C8A04DRAFT_39190 [Dichotomopilus funicola]|uniref:ATP-grasp domain-containing protein n=1 Tax=Dichotomopilus funicola TaxID=1934379 RepID=A0AAN6UYF8_9PEZI|nr:hypothetical protein C8A04DRAFT_39190 [Dichotomopilus funicola]